MTAKRWLLLMGSLAAGAAACGSPAAPPRSRAAAATVPERAQTLHALGLDLRRRGRLKEARAALERARDSGSAHEPPRERAEILNDLGEVLFQLGDFAGLERTERRALELAEAAGLRSAAATAWNNLGVAFAARGLPSASLEAQGHCLDLRRGLGDAAGEAAALHNRGVQLLALGRLREGVQELEDAVALHRRLGEKVELGQSLAALARGLAIDGQPDASLAAYGEALSVLSRADADYDLAVTLEQRAQVYRRLGRLREAWQDLERSLTLAESRGGASRFHTAYLHLGFGAVLREQGRPAGAVPLLRRAVTEFDALAGQEGRIVARLELARALRAGGSRAEAITVLEAALAIVESARADLRLAALRSTYLSGWQDVYRELIDMLAEAARESSYQGERRAWAVRAFDVSERARARALLDLLATPPPPKGLLARGGEARLGRLRSRVEQLEARALALDGGTAEADPRLQEPGSCIDAPGVVSDPGCLRLAGLRRLRMDLDLLEEVAANDDGWQPKMAQPASLATILAQLDRGTTLLAYSLGAERSWLWRIDHRGVDIYPLKAGPRIEAAARNAHVLLAKSGQIGYRKAARYARQYLSQLVLGPLAGVSILPRVAVIPDGALHLVPFAALDLPAGEGTVRTLGDDHEVVHLPSASSLVELRRRRCLRHLAPRLLAIVADPVFEADDPRLRSRPSAQRESAGDLAGVLARTRQALGGRFGRLFGSGEEARRIAEIARQVQGRSAVPVMSGFDATRELVTSGRLDRFRVLHFASHALADADDPALAGLLLSLYRADGQPRDGLLRARDLFGLKLSADLAVLSACQTALGQQVRGEGMVGLAYGFFAAGASQLIVSLWEVNDRATAELMSRFYSHLLLHRRCAADALRRAQREMRDETQWRSPAYWAAFIALGDWQAGAELGSRVGRIGLAEGVGGAASANRAFREEARKRRKSGARARPQAGGALPGPIGHAAM